MDHSGHGKTRMGATCIDDGTWMVLLVLVAAVDASDDSGRVEKDGKGGGNELCNILDRIVSTMESSLVFGPEQNSYSYS